VFSVLFCCYWFCCTKYQIVSLKQDWQYAVVHNIDKYGPETVTVQTLYTTIIHTHRNMSINVFVSMKKFFRTKLDCVAVNVKPWLRLSRSLPWEGEEDKKLSCRRKTARRFVLNHSRSLKIIRNEMTLLSRACISPY